MTFTIRLITLLHCVAIASGCTTSLSSDPEHKIIDNRSVSFPNLSPKIPGLSVCNKTTDSTIHLNSKEPVTVIVHGCYGSAARFRSLAQVFAFHGQQAVCFNYDYRDSMLKSSAELIDALESLSAMMESRKFTIVGHSQGGLISRKALIKERRDGLLTDDASLRLVTISAPFAGIAAADHCASSTARILTLGLVNPICRLISGDKWYEITYASAFIQEAGKLLEQVASHLKIVTDETDTCRRYNAKGYCVEDDYVFSVEEQYFAKVDGSERVENIEVRAGHAEIVGNYQVPPKKLIMLLQSQGIMYVTPPARQEELDVLLAELYEN